MAAKVRSLTHAEEAAIAEVLRRLREHYPAWPGSSAGQEHHLLAFAYYEGCGHRWECCREILLAAAPVAVGQELVANHGFRWVMIRVKRAWRYAVAHPALDQPINLESLEEGGWNEEEYDQAPCPGRMTLDSLATIVKRVQQAARRAET